MKEALQYSIDWCKRDRAKLQQELATLEASVAVERRPRLRGQRLGLQRLTQF
jgi:hypothetical protein